MNLTELDSSRWICKQAIIKLWLAHSFRKVFFIGQNSRHVHSRWVSNRRGGRNKRGVWQKSLKLINREVGINGEAGKNTAKYACIMLIYWHFARCMLTRKTLSGSKCIVVMTQNNIISHLALSEHHLFCCIFDESEGKRLAILNRKNNSQYEKIHATQKNA